MEKNEIISRVEEILHNKYDAGGIDSELVEDCVDSTLVAINYTHSCKSDSEQLTKRKRECECSGMSYKVKCGFKCHK